jgi:hypothetical protein
MNLKSVAAMVVAAVLTGSVMYLVQQREVERLRSENHALVAQQQMIGSDQAAAAEAARAMKETVARLQKDTAELVRLRNEVSQLRRERGAAKALPGPAAAPATDSVASPGNPGRYITKEQLAFVGYTTPEAGLESTTWAMMKGNYEQAMASLGGDLQQNGLNDPKSREQFETGRTNMAPLFKGMQIMAKKLLAEDRVELKVNIDADPIPNSTDQPPTLYIQPMVKVGNEWRLGGSTHPFQENWDHAGNIQPVGQ